MDIDQILYFCWERKENDDFMQQEEKMILFYIKTAQWK